MQVEVMRTIASRGLRILGSGTFSTFTLYGLHQVTAFMTFATSADRDSNPRGAGASRPRVVKNKTRALEPAPRCRRSSARRFRTRPARLAVGRRNLAGLHHALEPAEVFFDLAGGV